MKHLSDDNDNDNDESYVDSGEEDKNRKIILMKRMRRKKRTIMRMRSSRRRKMTTTRLKSTRKLTTMIMKKKRTMTSKVKAKSTMTKRVQRKRTMTRRKTTRHHEKMMVAMFSILPMSIQKTRRLMSSMTFLYTSLSHGKLFMVRRHMQVILHDLYGHICDACKMHTWTLHYIAHISIIFASYKGYIIV